MAKASGGSAGRAMGSTSNPKIMTRQDNRGLVQAPTGVRSSRMLPNTLHGSRFFIHRDPYGGKTWVVSEYATGLKIASGKTQKLAMADFDVQIAKFRDQASRGDGMEKEWRRMIRSAISRFGRANRG